MRSGLPAAPWFIGSEIYRLAVYQPPHPLAVDRAMLAKDLCDALGWLTPEHTLEAPLATDDELAVFHDRDYIAALHEAEDTQDLPAALRERTRIGADANPIHPAVFRRPAVSAGGALRAAALTADGGIVHAPGVGNHHAWPGRASGFCYVNDVALLILRWRAMGIRRIAYLDLDAHHGDGVEAAFATTPEVLTISVHERDRWPRTGTGSDPARGIWNFAVPRGFNDSELAWLWDETLRPLIAAHRPDGIVFLPGADALADDPMARLGLSNNALWAVAAALPGMAPRLVAGGGGGYNPYALARCWAGVFGTLAGKPIPASLPAPARDVLRRVRYFRPAGRNPPAPWLETLRDAPCDGPVRDEIKYLAAEA